jgi:hypothetical protein
MTRSLIRFAPTSNVATTGEPLSAAVDARNAPATDALIKAVAHAQVFARPLPQLGYGTCLHATAGPDADRASGLTCPGRDAVVTPCTFVTTTFRRITDPHAISVIESGNLLLSGDLGEP